MLGYMDPMILFVISLFVWIICMIDISISLLRRGEEVGQLPVTSGEIQEQNENFMLTVSYPIILLSFIPGAGHFYLGLMQRGVVIMLTFFGLLTLISFFSSLTNTTLFFVFLFLLPVVWFYSLFDSIHLHKRKEKGEELVDSVDFTEFSTLKNALNNNKLIYLLLSIIPGAGHMFLGKITKGIQVMAVFFISLFMINELRLTMLLFIIPLIWFYSFFDVMKQKEGEPEGIKWLSKIPRWLGISLVIVGLYYLLVRVALPVVDPYVSVRLLYLVNSYLNHIMGSIILIVAGYMIIKWNKNPKSVSES